MPRRRLPRTTQRSACPPRYSREERGTRPGKGSRVAVQTDRAKLHELVDRLSEESLAAAKRYVEFLFSGSDDLMTWMLENAPEDDEPSTPDEDRAAEAAWQEYLRDGGGGLSSEDAKRALLG